MNKKILLFLLLNSMFGIYAKNIEYFDDYFCVASPGLITLVDNVSQEIGYKGCYELLEPTVLGAKANPWTGMICAFSNPVTKNNAISIDQAWFNTLSTDAQKFLITRSLIKLDEKIPWVIRLFSEPEFVTYFCFWLLMILCSLGLRILINLMGSKIIKAGSILSLIITLCVLGFFINWFVVPKIQQQVLQYSCYKFDSHLNQLTLAKLPNKAAAIEALNACDLFVKNGVKDGHVVFKTSENVFSNLAKELAN